MARYTDSEQVEHVAGVGLTDAHFKPETRFGSDWQAKGWRTVVDEAVVFQRMPALREAAHLAGRTAPLPENPRPYDIPGAMLSHAYLGQKVLARVYESDRSGMLERVRSRGEG